MKHKYKLVTDRRTIGYTDAETEAEALDNYEVGIFVPAGKDTGERIRAISMGDIPTLLKAYREKKEITQRELADVMDVAVMTIIRWEYGRMKPSRMALRRMKEVGIL